MAAAPSYSGRSTRLKKKMRYTKPFCDDPMVTFVSFTLHSNLIRSAPVHTAVRKRSKADLFASPRQHSLLTCTSCLGNGVDLSMYADDVSSSINDKFKHNYQTAMRLWSCFFLRTAVILISSTTSPHMQSTVCSPQR